VLCCVWPGGSALGASNDDQPYSERAPIPLHDARDTFRGLVDNSPFGIYTVDADFRLAHVSQGAQKVFENVRPLIGRDLAEALRIIWPEPFATEAIGRFRDTLETGLPYHAPSTVEQRADVETVEAYDWKIERITMPDGRYGVVCNFYDLSERQRHTEHIQLLMHEMNHRAKNLLSVVQTLARQTAASGSADFVERFERRIRSLSASQDVLVRNAWAKVPLEDLIRSQLAHHKELLNRRIFIRGPVIQLTATAAQTIGMVIHELATNAAKYGALSNDTGVVSIEWELSRSDGQEPRLELSWTESGGPPVVKPSRKGFGSEVIGRMVKMSLRCEPKLEYAQDGFRWRMSCPSAAIIETDSSLN